MSDRSCESDAVSARSSRVRGSTPPRANHPRATPPTSTTIVPKRFIASSLSLVLRAGVDLDPGADGVLVDGERDIRLGADSRERTGQHLVRRAAGHLDPRAVSGEAVGLDPRAGGAGS